MLHAQQTHPRLRRWFAQMPAGQFLRFVLVGIWNTLFGYATFALLAFILSREYARYGYILAAGLSSVMNITVAFLGYKWFVFKTQGNYLREWIRCFAVYGSSILIGLMLLPLLVYVIRRLTPFELAAPYIGAALLALFNALYSFFGNRKFTFGAST